MQKTIDNYDLKVTEMQKQIDLLIQSNNTRYAQNQHLNDKLNTLTDTHQNEMKTMKSDLKTLEDKLLYSFNEYWTEMIEKIDKLDTRVCLKTTKKITKKKNICLLFFRQQKLNKLKHMHLKQKKIHIEL